LKFVGVKVGLENFIWFGLWTLVGVTACLIPVVQP